MTPEVQAKITELRQKSALGTMSLDDMRWAVAYLREARGKARPAVYSAPKAAKPVVDAKKLLEGL